MNQSSPELKPIGRHGFISFWLYFCIIINTLAAVSYVTLLFSSKGMYSSVPEPIWLRLVWILLALIVVMGYSLLLRRKQLGFYVLIGASVFNILISLILTGFSMYAFSPVISVVLLYFILQLRSEGVPYWKTLGK